MAPAQTFPTYINHALRVPGLACRLVVRVAERPPSPTALGQRSGPREGMERQEPVPALCVHQLSLTSRARLVSLLLSHQEP